MPSAPRTLFIELTTECNSRCRYCHMWTLEDGPGKMSLAERSEIVRQFAALSPGGEVVLTGGETMRGKEEFFALCRLCRSLGLRSAANTNGSYIEPRDDERILAEGPTYLVFSLDSHLPAIHDYDRGTPGSFAATVATMSRLIQRKGEAPPPGAPEILTNSVVLEENIDSLLETLDFLAGLGVDGALLQILSPTFHRRNSEDPFYRRHFFRDPQAAAEVLQKLIRSRADYPILRATATDLRWMQRYILFPEETEPGVCGSHEKNMMVDYRGEVQLCFNMRKVFGCSLGNVRSSGLAEIWNGIHAGESRLLMSSCRRACGMLNCHRRET